MCYDSIRHNIEKSLIIHPYVDLRDAQIQYFYPNRMSVYKKKQEQTVQSIEKLTQFALHALEKFNIGLCLACCDNLNHLLTEVRTRSFGVFSTKL